MHGSVRYSKLASAEPAEEPQSSRAEEQQQEEEESDGGEVTVYLTQPDDTLNGKDVKKDTWFRVMVALILLGIVFGFMLCEWYRWWPDPLGLQTHLSNDAGVLEEHHHDHHNHHEGEEDDDHEDGDHHHDPGGHSHDHTSLYHHGVVLTSSAYCSRAGKELLREGGNVVDAAIASLLCLGVVHPHTSGVGGMFSAVLYNFTTGSCNSIRSTAPQLPSASYGVPSVLQGLKDLHSQWGRSEWSRLFKDAITLAEDGFHIDGVLGRALATHKEKILQSEACDIFCDGSGRVKSAGVLAGNQNLSELLRAASLNESHFPETLAMKLAEDLSARERPTFLAALRQSRGEINESLIAPGEKYTVLSAGSPYAGPMLSDILERVREQSLSFQSAAGDLNRAAATFASLLNLTQGLDNRAPAEKNQDLAELLALDTQSSHIGVLDGKGNFIVMSASLNNTWGSGRFLPSSGVMLSSFTSNISDVPYFSFPLLVKINNDDDDDSNDTESNDTQGESEEDKEVQIIATTGGLSALLNAAVLLQRLDFGTAPADAVSSPLLHLQWGNSTAMAVCLSSISNSSDVYRLLSETDGQLQQVDECSDGTLSMVLRFHAEHASAYGAPVSSAHADGY
ncbi:glutathione hydrolase 6 isoform X1 [Astyanax mexicanus]|uniref:glutathione hydrolase 6 isoform X1 n=2 Tax=Astyanax mexicanus TaxID=7994 RepID=UPI0020CB2A0C|nr:glutathione hydrolase 6 isoform X1 [Astyanax mexicanus]